MHEEKSKTLKTTLVTQGRRTGNEHKVILRAVKLNDKFYFSRHQPDSDWFKNALFNSKVKLEFDGSVFLGNAKKILDDTLAKKISELKYPGEKRAKEKRVVLEVKLDEQL